jgi:Asp-tRNA(Asn)/Glu-tRNA(Gln) amidotransferase A subunit family amidase
MANDSANTPDLSRRAWMMLGPALAAVLSEVELAAQQRNSPDQTPQKVTVEMLKQALATIGLEFPEDQLKLALNGVNRNLASYERLRALPIPYDTEPAFRFLPALPGKEPKKRPAKFSPSKISVPSLKWTSNEELAFLPLTDLAALVKARRVSSTELTRMYLERLKRYAPKLNFVVTLTEELALREAAQADAEIKSGKYRGPLHGIPYGAKDLFATKGIRTTWGAEPFENQMIDYDATVITRMREAGAVLVAKLSMGALAQGGLWFGGMTKNPWNTERTSSGSSAGSASATSAGCVGFSIGTETLGSIISPSTTCGVTGLRPTYGRVSRYGAMGLSWTMDKIGPICRGVEDCALVLNAMYGPDGRDNTTLDAPLDWNPAIPVSGLRVGFTKVEFDRMSGDRKKIYEDALEVCRKAGMKLEPVELPEFPTQQLMFLLSAEAAAAFDDITRDGQVGKLKGQAPGDWPNTFRTARAIPAVEYIRAQRARTLLQHKMDEFFSRWDVLISSNQSASLSITNLTGQPQVVVKCGILNQDQPVGLCFAGRLYEEGTPLRAALAYEQATEWRKMHPKLS